MTGFSTDGILLRKTEYGDYDLILTFFTLSMGRISVIAKNAKKSIRRFAGALDMFSVMNIQCSRQKRLNALPVLCSVDLDNPFARIRTNAVKTSYASYWVELVNSWMEEGKEQSDLYDLLLFVLDGLNSGSVSQEILSLLFQIRFMNISGFSPRLDQCGICEKPLDDINQNTVSFSCAEGKLVCDRCRKSHPVNRGIEVSKGTLKQLSWINFSDLGRMERIRFSETAIQEGEMLLESFIPYHIGREVKSLKVLKRIKQYT
ncbi:MAG: DNA repair protein RecO [Pseudomonadota bacterium]